MRYTLLFLLLSSYSPCHPYYDPTRRSSRALVTVNRTHIIRPSPCDWSRRETRVLDSSNELRQPSSHHRQTPERRGTRTRCSSIDSALFPAADRAPLAAHGDADAAVIRNGQCDQAIVHTERHVDPHQPTLQKDYGTIIIFRYM